MGFVDTFNDITMSAMKTLMDDAVLILSDGRSSPLEIVFTQETTADELADAVDILPPQCECFAADAIDAQRGDTLDISGRQYRIADIYDQGDGMLTLMLRENRLDPV